MRLELYLFSFEDHDTGPIKPSNPPSSHRTPPAPPSEHTILHQRPLYHEARQPPDIPTEPRIRLTPEIIEHQRILTPA